MSDASRKPWAGRFTEPTDKLVERFTASVHFDQRLWQVDVRGSIAHAKTLHAASLLSDEELEQILSGLARIEAEIKEGKFEWKAELEDVHMNIETRLIELIGDAGGKLHTGRSRNDQVATDVRLWLRDEIDAILALARQLQSAMLDLADINTTTVMPGYTHLQMAQPITFGHHIMAWFEMLDRDVARLVDARKRMNVSPLGAAALAGSSFNLDRDIARKELGFSSISANSLDAVSDRDFVIEFLSCASTMSVHFSRWCEEIILWMSQSLRMISLPDEVCTGSSIMPQKKNPDVAELIRGKSARITGHLTTVLILMKGQPLAYNRDNQEDKVPLFDSVDTLKDMIAVLAVVIGAIEPDHARMAELANDGYGTATDLADWLVKEGIPFRRAHDIVGQLVRIAEIDNIPLSRISLDKAQAVEPKINADVLQSLDVERSVALRNLPGGTAPDRVRMAIATARRGLRDT